MSGDEDRPAPGELALVEALINTADLEDGTDALSDAAALGAWLRERGLAGPRDAFSERDRDRVIGFREALRRVLLAHHGGEPDPEAVAALDATAREVHVVVAFAADGAPRLAPAGSGADAALASLLAVIARAEADGTWARLKTCPAEDCQWAFYDHSRNRSRTWCRMSVCGNRAKTRAYRNRASRAGR